MWLERENGRNKESRSVLHKFKESGKGRSECNTKEGSQKVPPAEDTQASQLGRGEENGLSSV